MRAKWNWVTGYFISIYCGCHFVDNQFICDLSNLTNKDPIVLHLSWQDKIDEGKQISFAWTSLHLQIHNNGITADSKGKLSSHILCFVT